MELRRVLGRAPTRLVAFVGNDTVSEVLPVSAVALACASNVPPRVKFTTGRPKPMLSKRWPAIENVSGGYARSIGFGVIPVTAGADRLSATVGAMLLTSG